MNGPSEYYLQVQAEDDRLEAVLAGIRQRQDQGRLSTREAADERVAALEAHLARVRELRRLHLGDGE